MKIDIVHFGKIRDNHVKALTSYYQMLASKYVEINLISLRDPGTFIGIDDLRKYSEAENIYLLSEKGKELTTVEFAKLLSTSQDSSIKRIFIVGNAFGFDATLFQKIPSLSLSQLTFPHEIAIMLLLEQLFRCLNLNAGGKYHK